MNTKTNTIMTAINAIDGAAWDLKIIDNAIVNAIENEAIVIPDIDNDPLRLSLLALQVVRANLEEQSKALMELCKEPDGEETT